VFNAFNACWADPTVAFDFEQVIVLDKKERRSGLRQLQDTKWTEAMKRRSRNRSTHVVDTAALDFYKAANGITSDAMLAKRAGVSKKTISRAYAGESISNEKIDCICRQALGGIPAVRLLKIDPALRVIPLANMIDVKVPMAPDRRIPVRITLAVDFEAMKSSTTLLNFQRKLETVLHTTHPVNVVDLKKGSTVVVVEMSTHDILRLFAAIIDRSLADAAITRIELDRYSWIRRMVIALRVLGTPVEPDARTLSDIVDPETTGQMYGDLFSDDEPSGRSQKVS
jgi:hypothetical protein